MSTEKSSNLLKTSQIFLVSFIIANPFILFLLFQDLFISIFLYFFVLGLLLFFFNYKAKWPFVYLLNFLIVITIFLHFEVVFKHCYSKHIIKDLYIPKSKYFFNKPYLNLPIEGAEFSATYRTNKQGFRVGKINSLDLEVKECDWLFVGDSYTQGAQVDYYNLFTSKLFEHFPNKIIINAGISGYGIIEEYLFFRDIGSKLKPKKVFLQISNFNDFMNVKEKTFSLSEYLMHYSDFLRSILYGLKYTRHEELPLGRWTEPFYPTVIDNINYNIFYKISSKKKESDIGEFKKYLSLFKKEINKIGAELILILIPTKEQIYYDYFNEVIEKFHINIKNLDMSIPNKILKEFSVANNIKFIDMTYEYPKYSKMVFFGTDEHLNSYGHHVTSEIISKYLIDHGKNIFNNRLLNTFFSADRYPSYTPDGEKVLFQSIVDGFYDIMLADKNFLKINNLTKSNYDEIHPSISSDGLNVLFTRGNQASHNTNIVLMNLEDRTTRIITKAKNKFGAIPSFSKNGKLITYAQWSYDNNLHQFTTPQIVICDLYGNNELFVTKGNTEKWRPLFSHDSKFLYYIMENNQHFDIFKYDILTHEEIQLTNTEYDEWDLNLSPDGKSLVYAANKNGNWDLFIMDVKGKNNRQITYTKGDEWDPNYSPDAKEIIYGGEFGFLGGIYLHSIKDDK